MPTYDEGSELDGLTQELHVAYSLAYRTSDEAQGRCRYDVIGRSQGEKRNSRSLNERSSF